MKNYRDVNIIDLSNKPKEAALFFDKVIPCYFIGEEEIMREKIYKELLPNGLEFNVNIDASKVNQDLALIILHNAGIKFLSHGKKNMEQLPWKEIKMYLDLVLEFKNKYYCHDSYFLPSNLSCNVEKQPENILLHLPNIPLVNLDRTPWDKILEFRKDRNSIQKFRRFRNFLNKNYCGKSKSFIEDDLLIKMEDYELTLKEWGFETITTSLDMLFSSKILFGTGIGATLSTLCNAPIAALTTISAGALVEFGKISLHLIKRDHQYNILLQKNDLSYISYAKIKLE